MKKAVFIRLDKIGDLICTLPIDQAASLKDWDVTWVVSKGLGFIPDHSVPSRKYIELDKNNPRESREKLEALLRELQPEAAISIQAPWWVNFTLWKSRVKKRIGVLSKWDSFIFLNAGLRQKRSQALKHEADYNFDLALQVAAATGTPNAGSPVLQLKAQPQPALLSESQLEPKKYVVVHAGMAGSALNWPIAHYQELVQDLTSKYKVVLTGTPADEPWLKDLKERFKSDSQVVILQNKLNAIQLLYILEQARAVFAPSTGVIHMAASLGTPVYGFYSPIRVQTALRWGPRGSEVHTFTPPTDGPPETWMSLITPAQVLKEFV